MDLNIYRPVQSLQRPAVTVGGMCSLTVFKIEDVLQWPATNPLTGILDTSVQLKPGKTMYIVQAVDKGRTFGEELKYDGAGPYVEMDVDFMIPGCSSANVLTMAAAQYHRWGIIVADRSGVYRLIGNEDSGAKLYYKYTSGDGFSTRKTTPSWVWQSPLPAPLYQAQVFNITIGGITITAGSLRLLQNFQVSAPGSPMVHGQTTLANNAFANKKLLVLIDGVAIPCDDGSGNIDWTAPQNAIRRHYEKTLAANTIIFIGGVVQDEIIEIYEIA